MENEYSGKRMESIQGAASICSSGALRTTPNHALNAILYLLPADLLRNQLAANLALRLGNHPH